MNEKPNHNSQPGLVKRLFYWAMSWRILRRALLAVAVGGTLLATFYTIENWRGKRAWEQCKRDLIAAGYEMDWNKLIPPPVPDEQNIFKAPHMQEWFVRPTGFSASWQNQQPTTNFLLALKHPNQALFGKDSRITNAVAATEFLEWSSQFAAEFEVIRLALQRPSARMEGDYSQPYEIPIVNFVVLRNFAQILAQRAHCHLLLGQPEEALADLTFLHATRKLLLGEPTGKPMTLVAAMIHVAITGLYTGVVEEGLQTRVWQHAQLLALESQLAELSLPVPVYEALCSELTASSYVFEHEPFSKLLAMSLVVTKPASEKSRLSSWWDRIKGLKLQAYNLAPRGWLFQNLAVSASLERMLLESTQGCQTNMQPKKIHAATQKFHTEIERPSLFNLIAKIAIPNCYKALQNTAKNQTAVNQARIACALERYRQTHGQYPDLLAVLQPQFLPALPNDLIGNQPLKYRREPDGYFVLYSVGWNETDDGGVVMMKDKSSTNVAPDEGDWVWRSTPQTKVKSE